MEPGTLLGIPTGFPTIDRASSGLQKEQLVLMVGLPAAGKSTGALLMAKAAHEQGHVPMFVGFEMSNKEQQTRYAAIKANIDHHRLFTGRLSVEEKKRFKKLLHQLEDQPDFHMVADPSATSTISGIMSKIEAYTPAVVIIDGVYLMIDEQTGEQNTSKALTNITRSLKRMAQRYKIPIVGTTQVLPWKVSKKTGITADSIGYTSSFAQDADVILGLESTDEGDDIKLLKIVKARNMRLRKTKLEWSWETGVFEERGYEEDFEDDDET
jgi:replicative DNA helicase